MTEEVGRNGTPPVHGQKVVHTLAMAFLREEETIFWLEREIARLQSGDLPAHGGDSTGEEMARLKEQRRRETGSQ